MEGHCSKALLNIGLKTLMILRAHKKFLIIELICVVWLPRVNGRSRLKKTSKFLYIISPKEVKYEYFYNNLLKVFKSRKVSFFQLRLKKEKSKKIIFIGKKIKKLCKKYNVKLMINDSPILAKKIGADGCHLGQSDSSILSASDSFSGRKYHSSAPISFHNRFLIDSSVITGASFRNIRLNLENPDSIRDHARKNR